MALIETAEGQTLIVERESKQTTMNVKARVATPNSTIRFDERLFKLYGKSADRFDSRPRSRGEVTSEKMSEIANRLIGYLVAEGRIDRRADAEIRSIDVYEVSTVSKVDMTPDPEWIDGYPEDGTMVDQIRAMVEYDRSFTDSEIVGTVGCSGSLVQKIRARIAEEEEEQEQEE